MHFDSSYVLRGPIHRYMFFLGAPGYLFVGIPNKGKRVIHGNVPTLCYRFFFQDKSLPSFPE